MSIPLVQDNNKDSINTSIIAIKRNIERINMLLGLSNSEEIDTSEFVKKSDIVDEVTVGNMQSVTSNAVAEAIGEWKKILDIDVTYGSFIRYKNSNPPELHIHLNDLRITNASIGAVIATIPRDYRPTSVIRGLVDVDLFNTGWARTGRTITDVDITPNGSVNIYPALINQPSGSIGNCILYGDIFVSYY